MNNNKTFNILLVEDSPELAMVYREYLRSQPFEVNHVMTGAEAIKAFQTSVPDMVLLDYILPDMTGESVLRYLHDEQVATQVIVMTAHGSVDIAVECIRLGAFDFLTKPFDSNRLQITIKNAIQYQTQSIESAVSSEGLKQSKFHGFIGDSVSMQPIYKVIQHCATSIASVFITGESGTGKEVCARALHDQSSRSEKPFITFNCAAIPSELMESEIFGHVSGSFTGATANREGAASLADGGTLFLDELCEMNLDLQSKLLRFVQTGTFQKVGSNKLEEVDIRFICATNRDVALEVKEGRFREDLFYRLHVIPIELPPLRSRGKDIQAIAGHFLSKYSAEEKKHFLAFSNEVNAFFLTYNWPGNVRQLQNVIRNIVVLNDAREVTMDMLPKPLDAYDNQFVQDYAKEGHLNGTQVSADQSSSPQTIPPLWVIEKNAIEHAIEFCGGNIPRAAALLEVSPSTIYRKRELWKQAEQ